MVHFFLSSIGFTLMLVALADVPLLPRDDAMADRESSVSLPRRGQISSAKAHTEKKKKKDASGKKISSLNRICNSDDY